KQISTLVILLLPLFLMSQIAGRKTKAAIMIFDSVQVKAGDTIYLGKGSGTRGSFEYIYQPMNALAGSPEMSLGRNYANMKGVIKHFKNQRSRKAGDKIVAVTNFGGLNNVV